MLLENGYVKNDVELKMVNAYFEAKLPKYDFTSLGFREKLWLYKANLWHSFLTQDFLKSFKYATTLVNLFNAQPKYIDIHPVFYLKGKNYLLESCFLVKHLSKLKKELLYFEEEIDKKIIPQDSNTQILTFLYLYKNKLHLHFLEGSFEEGEYLVEIIENKIALYANRLDGHHVVMMYYKIACLYLGMKKNKKCIEYLDKIIHSKKLSVAEDLQCFARVLSLIAHYECGLDYDLERQFKDTYRFLLKMENLQEVQKVFITSIKEIQDVYSGQIKHEFKKIYDRLKVYETHPYEKRAFLYLDILSWLECKIANKSVATIIKEKNEKLLR